MNTHLRDNLLHVCSTTGNLTITTAGPHAIGSAVLTNVGLLYAATFTPSGAVANAGLAVGPTINAEANQDTYVLDVAGTIVEAGSGTHALFSTMRIRPPTITAGAATLSNAVTLHINGVPASGTFTAALFIDALGDDGIHIAMADGTDVNHGITSLAPTSVYFLVRKSSATEGGASLQGYAEGNAGFKISTVVTTAVTTEAGASTGAIQLISEIKSGTAGTAMGADDNTVVFKNNVNATHIFKGNGDSYEDGAGWTAYDNEDDHGLIEAIDHVLDPALRSMRADASEWLAENESALERLRIVTFNRDTDGRPFVNKSRLAMLHNGALRLAVRRIAELEQRLIALEKKRG